MKNYKEKSNGDVASLFCFFEPIVRRRRLAIIWFAACFLVVGVSARQPNILLILADDLGYGDLSVQGCTQFQTPHIDSIAEKGIRFRQGYVSNSVCAPSRAGLLSGRIGIGFESNLPHNSKYGLDPSLPTMADLLKGAGYKTFCIGKWHLGYQPEHHPNQRGFDEFYGLIGGSRSYFAETTTPKLIREGKMLERNGKVEDDPEGSYITDRLTEGAIDYLNDHFKKQPNQPFFMYLSYTAPHGPLHAKPGYAERFQKKLKNPERQIYAGMMVSFDESVGQMLECLEKNRVLEDTLIVFLSDNGGPESDNASDNGALKGEKGSLWEGGVRVPFFVRWDGTIPAGRVVDDPVISLDLMPTFGAIAGVSQKVKTSGIDLWPLWLGKTDRLPERNMFWRRGGKMQCGFRDGQFKWLENRRTGDQWLFDLDADASEENNLLKQYPERAEKMKRAYQKWESSVPDPVFESGWKEKKK